MDFGDSSALPCARRWWAGRAPQSPSAALLRLARCCILTLTLCCLAARAALNDPFPMGYSMANFGAIMWQNGMSGRQPWTPAAFLRDSASWGLSAAGVDYFDDMDNLEGRDLRQAAAGGWFAVRKVAVKAAYIHFNALDIYREQEGFLSAATSVVAHVSLGAQLSAIRVGLVQNRDEREHVALGGATVWVPFSFASASFSCRNILLKDAHRPGFAPPLTLEAGLYTAPHRFGAQGVVVSVEPGDNIEIRFRAAEEYRIHDILGIGVALSTNPIMVSFGVSVCLRSYGVYTSLVHHPVLGWSKGIGAEYFWKRN